MHLCLIMDNPETPQHPVLAVALQALSARHTVRLLDIRGLSGLQAGILEKEQQAADLYLLKSHAPQALQLAEALEREGRRVINSFSASLACQDRVRTTELMQAVRLPWPQTIAFSNLSEALNDSQALNTPGWPMIIKSRFSRRGDLVDKLADFEQLEALGARWSQEPIVLQEYIPGDGWDIKLWVIDQRVFAARRRTPLEPGAAKEDFPIPEKELPNQWRELALAVGHAFKMPLYGVDLLLTAQGPLIVDVNAFPGFRGVPGASEALLDLIEQLLTNHQQ